MNDEIKEILYYYQKGINRYEKNMKNYTEYQQKTTFSKYHQRYKNHKLLLDYITNLQEENEKVHKELDYADNYNIYLISKIDKAIEYMYETLECNYHGANITFDELIHNTEDILKGDNK